MQNKYESILALGCAIIGFMLMTSCTVPTVIPPSPPVILNFWVDVNYPNGEIDQFQNVNNQTVETIINQGASNGT